MHRILAVVAIIMLLSCSSTLAQDRIAIAFENRPDAAQMRVKEPGVVVFRDERGWRDFWAAHHENMFAMPRELPPPPPYVDFRRSTLIGIFWGVTSGCRSNATYVERTDRVVRSGADLIVSLMPLGSLGLCRAVSLPLQMIEVPRVPGHVVVTGAVPSGT